MRFRPMLLMYPAVAISSVDFGKFRIFNPQKLPSMKHFKIQDFVKMMYSRVLHFDKNLYFEELD